MTEQTVQVEAKVEALKPVTPEKKKKDWGGILMAVAKVSAKIVGVGAKKALILAKDSFVGTKATMKEEIDKEIEKTASLKESRAMVVIGVSAVLVVVLVVLAKLPGVLLGMI